MFQYFKSAKINSRENVPVAKIAKINSREIIWFTVKTKTLTHRFIDVTIRSKISGFSDTEEVKYRNATSGTLNL